MRKRRRACLLEIPVLVVNGDRDRMFCGLNSADCTSSESLAAHERQFYGPGATVEAYVIEGAGHVLLVERTAPLSAQRMIAFSEQYVGHGAGAVGTAPGTRPAPAMPPEGTPSPQAKAASEAFVAAVLPLSDAYNPLVRPIPGLGDTTNPNPASAALLSQIGNLVNQLLGSLPQDLSGG